MASRLKQRSFYFTRPLFTLLQRKGGSPLYCLKPLYFSEIVFQFFFSLVFQSYEAVVGTCPNLHRTRVSAHAFEKPLYFLFVIRSWILIPFFRHFAKEKIATKFMKLNLLLLEKSIIYGMVTYSTKEAGI